MCTYTHWMINQQWWLHRKLISWYSWYTYLHLVFLIRTGVYKPRNTSFWMYLRFMITLAMQLQSLASNVCPHCNTLWVTSTVSPGRLYLNGSWTGQEVLAVELLSDLGEYIHLSETSEEKLKKFVQIFVYGISVLMYALIFYLWLSGSSHQRDSVKKGVLKNFAVFTGKHLCWSLFLKKLQAWRPATLLKRGSNTGVFLWV